jgi:hypothetical protein
MQNGCFHCYKNGIQWNLDLSFFKGVEKTNDEYGETINPKNHFFTKKKSYVVYCGWSLESRLQDGHQRNSHPRLKYLSDPRPRLDADEFLHRQILQNWMTVVLATILASRLLNFIFSCGAII